MATGCTPSARLGAAQTILVSMDEMTLADLVMRNTDATHLYFDIFSVPDSVIEIKDYQDQVGAPLAGTTHNSVTALKTAGAKAGWLGSAAAGWTCTDNPGDYLDARGVKNPKGTGNASSMIGGTEFAENIHGLGGNNAIYGDGGNDGINNNLVEDFNGDDIFIVNATQFGYQNDFSGGLGLQRHHHDRKRDSGGCPWQPNSGSWWFAPTR